MEKTFNVINYENHKLFTVDILRHVNGIRQKRKKRWERKGKVIDIVENRRAGIQ